MSAYEDFIETLDEQQFVCHFQVSITNNKKTSISKEPLTFRHALEENIETRLIIRIEVSNSASDEYFADIFQISKSKGISWHYFRLSKITGFDLTSEYNDDLCCGRIYFETNGHGFLDGQGYIDLFPVTTDVIHIFQKEFMIALS